MTPADRDAKYEKDKAQANRTLITLGRNRPSNPDPTTKEQSNE